MAGGAEFQPGQGVKVREEGGDPNSHSDQSVLGKQGIIWYGTGSEDSRLTITYFVELDSGEVESISPDWLEPR